MANFHSNNLFKNMPLALAYNKVIYDENNEIKNFIVLKINKKFEEITGFKKEDVINKKGFNILKDIVDKPNELIQICGEVASNGESKTLEIYSKITGNYYEVRVFNEKEGYFTTVFSDITDRKNKKEKLDSIYNNLDDIIYSLSWPDLKVQFISRSVKEIVGYTKKEFKENASLLREITRQDDKYMHNQAIQKIEKTGYVEREFRIITKEGNIKWMHEKAKMIYDENNNRIRIECIMRDITEKKITKNKLKYNREKYETIFSSAPLGIMIEDDKGDIIEVNKEMSKMSGYGKEELEDSNIIEKLVLSKYEEFAKNNIKRIINGENLEFDIETPMKSGEMNYYHLKETNIDLPSGEKGILSMHMDVTEQKKLEENLKEKNKLFNSVLESIQDGISVLDSDLTINYINSTMERWYEGELPLKGKKCYEGYYDKETRCKTCPVLKSLESGKMERHIKELSDEFELDFIEIFSYPIWDEDEENITGAVNLIRDISDRVKQRKKLEMMNFTVNNSDLLVFRTTPKGITDYVNETVLDKLNYEREEIIGEDVKKYLKTDNYINREKFWEKIKKSGSLNYERKYITKDGREFPVEITSQYFKYGDNEYEFVFAKDITERKKQQEKIKKQRDRMKYILEGTDAGTWEWNIQTGKTILNEKWAEMIGYTLEEIYPHNIETWQKFTHPDDLKKCEELFEKHVQGKKDQYKVEIRMKHKEGHWIWVLSQGKIISWTEDGKPLKMFGTHLDITERKKRIKELKTQHDFHKMLANISSKLIGIDNTNFDEEINNSLKKIGLFFEIDRSYIFQFSENKKHVTNTHEWTAVGIDSEKDNMQNLSVELLPWLRKKMIKKEVVNVFNVDKLKEKAKNERKIFQEQNIKSIVIIPIFIKDEIWGFFGFDSIVEKKNFIQGEIDKIKIITDVITSAVLQYSNIKRIKKLTYKDSLTGLYNRRYFEQEMERLDTKRQLPISIIMVDINGLKIINDSYGHETGDKMLIETGKILKEHIRNEDILARHGGDEFTILLPQTSNKEVGEIVSRLKDEDHKITKEGITISFSLGLATKANEDENIREVLKEADNDMYRNKLSESRSNKNKLVQNLLNTLETKSSETKNHAVRMTRLAQKLGEKLGLSNSELNKLSLIATLHDIGKTTISEDILTKSEKLIEKEWEIIKEHPVKGYKIASASEEFAVVAKEILCHHEHWNGNGYPDGLQGKDIPYLARIISIIDAYDVMTNERPYSKAISKEEALAEIKDCAGSQFDPELAQEFIELKSEDR